MTEDYLRDIAKRCGMLFYKHCSPTASDSFSKSYRAYVTEYPFKIYYKEDDSYKGLEISNSLKVCEFNFVIQGGDLRSVEHLFDSEEDLQDFIKKWCFSKKRHF